MGDKEPRIFLMAVKVFFPRKERQHWILFLESEKMVLFSISMGTDDCTAKLSIQTLLGQK
jgi:hypothetical protein